MSISNFLLLTMAFHGSQPGPWVRPTKGIFKNPRVESGRVRMCWTSTSVESGQSGGLQMSRVGPGRPDPTRPDPREAIRPAKSPAIINDRPITRATIGVGSNFRQTNKQKN